MKKQFEIKGGFDVWYSDDLNVLDIEKNYHVEPLHIIDSNLELLEEKGMSIDPNADYETAILDNAKVDVVYSPCHEVFAIVKFMVRIHGKFDVYVETIEGVRPDVTYEEFEKMTDYRDLFYPNFFN